MRYDYIADGDWVGDVEDIYTYEDLWPLFYNVVSKCQGVL